MGEGTSGLLVGQARKEARKASIGDSVDGYDDDTEASAVPRVFEKRPPPLFQVCEHARHRATGPESVHCVSH